MRSFTRFASVHGDSNTKPRHLSSGSVKDLPVHSVRACMSLRGLCQLFCARFLSHLPGPCGADEHRPLDGQASKTQLARNVRSAVFKQWCAHTLWAATRKQHPRFSNPTISFIPYQDAKPNGGRSVTRTRLARCWNPFIFPCAEAPIYADDKQAMLRFPFSLSSL